MCWVDKKCAADEDSFVRESTKSFEKLKHTFENELTVEERVVFNLVMSQRVCDYPSYLSMQIAAAKAGLSVEEMRELANQLLYEFGNRILNKLPD